MVLTREWVFTAVAGYTVYLFSHGIGVIPEPKRSRVPLVPFFRNSLRGYAERKLDPEPTVTLPCPTASFRELSPASVFASSRPNKVDKLYFIVLEMPPESAPRGSIRLMLSSAPRVIEI